MLDGYLWSVSIKYTQYGLCTILVKQWWDPGFNQRGMGGGGGWRGGDNERGGCRRGCGTKVLEITNMHA